MPIAERMIRRLQEFVVIKNMFEEGRQLKAKHGEHNVYDFSLGNPDVPPPPAFRKALREMAQSDTLSFGYAPVAGHRQILEALAERLRGEHGVAVRPDLIVMTVGASGALNDIFRALVNPGEEILVPAPYFLGYTNYAFLVDAVLKPVPTDRRFHLDLEAMAAAATPRTRLVLVNSPNNPTGAVYTAAEINELGQTLEKASRRLGRRIYLVADEPYRKITFGTAIPSVFAAYPHTIIANSFSKELSLAGERIGYFAVHPDAEDAQEIVAAAAAVNSMHVVNAPSLLQLAVAKVLGESVDVAAYERRRDLICGIMQDTGYEFIRPEGAFYLFPKSPIADDARFTDILRTERILVSPGRAFGTPGYFRISFAVPEATIAGSKEGFQRAMRTASMSS
jgi:aspartate aminotransferase